MYGKIERESKRGVFVLEEGRGHVDCGRRGMLKQICLALSVDCLK